MSDIILFQDKKDCCGCGACMNACPKAAVRMREDAQGFVYPAIDEALCIECGACTKACPYQNSPALHTPQDVYAASCRDDDTINRSASGGAFPVIAEQGFQRGKSLWRGV